MSLLGPDVGRCTSASVPWPCANESVAAGVPHTADLPLVFDSAVFAVGGVPALNATDHQAPPRPPCSGRCGGGERSPGADVAAVKPVPAQMWAGASAVPALMWPNEPLTLRRRSRTRSSTTG